MKQKIIEIVSEIRPEIRFTGEQDVEFFGVLDSLDIIMLVDEIEKKLNLIIEADQIIPENFSSLFALESFLRSLDI